MKTIIKGEGRWALIDICPSSKVVHLFNSKEDAENFKKSNFYRIPCQKDKSFCMWCSHETKIKEINSSK